MPSSTSNSRLTNLNVWERNIPKKNWPGLFVLALILFSLLILSWEMFWRSKGYEPSIDDNKDLWAYNREKVEKNPNGTVLIGASRMLFDFNLSVYEKETGMAPIQLSTVGTNATYYLDELANHSEFKGTLIMGVLPMLAFVPEGLPVQTPVGNIKYFNEWNLAKRSSFFLGLIPDRLFAFLEPGDLSVRSLLNELPIDNRKGTQLAPKLPPYFLEIQDLNRQGLMIKKTETDIGFQETIQQRWIPLFTPPPPPPIFTPEQFKKIFMDHMNFTISKMRENITKIKNRGGKVILVRFPGTNTVLELENKFSPNPGFWDRIKNETQANFSISFEDYPELQGYKCPEWSHLSRSDAVEYTKSLVKIMKEKALLN